MSRVILSLLIFFAINLFVTIGLSMFIENYYLVNILATVIIAFIYSLIVTPDKKTFFMQQNFYYRFFSMAIGFLFLDLLMFII